MEEAHIARLDAIEQSSEAYFETFGRRQKSAAQTGEAKASSPKETSFKEVTCHQITLILNKIKFEFKDQSDSSDHREPDNDHT